MGGGEEEGEGGMPDQEMGAAIMHKNSKLAGLDIEYCKFWRKEQLVEIMQC